MEALPPERQPQDYEALFADWVVQSEPDTPAYVGAVHAYVMALLIDADTSLGHTAEQLNEAFSAGLVAAAERQARMVPPALAGFTLSKEMWRELHRVYFATAEQPRGYHAGEWDAEQYLGWLARETAKRFSEFSLDDSLPDQTDG